MHQYKNHIEILEREEKNILKSMKPANKGKDVLYLRMKEKMNAKKQDKSHSNHLGTRIKTVTSSFEMED